MQEWTINKWTVSVRKDCNAVRVYRHGEFRAEIAPGKDTFRVGGALAFAQELAFELRVQSEEESLPERVLWEGLVGLRIESADGIDVDESIKRKRDDIFRKMFC